MVLSERCTRARSRQGDLLRRRRVPRPPCPPTLRAGLTRRRRDAERPSKFNALRGVEHRAEAWDAIPARVGAGADLRVVSGPSDDLGWRYGVRVREPGPGAYVDDTRLRRARRTGVGPAQRPRPCRVITTEAGGENRAAQTAVGWALRNRMTATAPTTWSASGRLLSSMENRLRARHPTGDRHTERRDRRSHGRRDALLHT